MAKEPLSIKKNLQYSPSMDYAKLKEEGIRLAQELSGDLWTDYNEHDPGVTILEQLCYALTELGYKTNFSVEDLLYARDSERQAFQPFLLFPPEVVLPAAPLTPLDYRKLLIDAIPEVRNAWLEIADQTQNGVIARGIYRVYLQLHQEAQLDGDARGEILDRVEQLLLANRNLCEDFDTIEVLEAMPVGIKADIQVQTDGVGEEILARILSVLSEVLTPQVKLYQRDELTDEQEEEEIFEGPQPVHGFFKTEELERSSLSTLNKIVKSRLSQAVAGIEGVREVSNFGIQLGGIQADSLEDAGELFELDPGVYPILDLTPLYQPSGDDFPIRLSVGDLPYELDLGVVRHSFSLLRSEMEQRYRVPVNYPPPIVRSEKVRKEIARFYSIQNSFPENYGIGPLGIPRNLRGRTQAEQKARMGHAKQLKAYLLFFEQIMANHLAQLTQLKELFSFEQVDAPSYYWQSLYDTVPGLGELLGENEEKINHTLGGLMQNFDANLERRDQLINHLLALFGEEFLSEAYNQLNRQEAEIEEEVFQRSLLKAKGQFLKRLISLTRDRGLGHNFRKGYDRASDRPALHQRVNLLLNLLEEKEGRLSMIGEDKRLSYPKTEPKAGNAIRFSSPHPFPLYELLRYGVKKDAFSIRPLDKAGKTYGLYFQGVAEEAEQVVFSAANQGECIQTMKKLKTLLGELNEQGEGFYLLEHILFRPTAAERFAFIVEAKGKRWLRSPFKYPSEKAGQDAFLKELRALTSRPNQFVIFPYEQARTKYFRVIARNEKGRVIATSDSFLDRVSADKARREMVALLKANQKNLKALVKPQEMIQRGEILADDPYSLQLSVILPDWPARFQSDRFREVFASIMLANAPAHLRIHISWLTIEQMREFEEIYFRWSEQKASPVPEQPLLDDLSYYLLLLNLSFRQPDHENVRSDLPILRKQYL